MTKGSRGFRSIQGALANLLRDCPQSRQAVAAVLEWIEQLERERQGEAAASFGGHQKSAGARRGDAIKGYKIDAGRQGEMLVERRYDSAKDFRCGYDVYMATAETLARAPKRGVGFDAIMDGTTKRLGWHPPEYLPRLCVRFWLFGKDPILIRSRARYEPIEPEKFIRQAEDAWRALAKRAKK